MLIMLYLFHVKLQDFCESQKCILVRIESWDENDWIRKQMKTGKDMILLTTLVVKINYVIYMYAIND
jgi:EamA domain-containing membrane protein RarD